jgi:hypothetical protein
MNAPELLAGFNRRSNIRGLDVVGATAALVVVVTAAVLLATFEAVAWEMKALARTLAPGKNHARLDRHATYGGHSFRWKT